MTVLQMDSEALYSTSGAMSQAVVPDAVSDNLADVADIVEKVRLSEKILFCILSQVDERTSGTEGSTDGDAAHVFPALVPQFVSDTRTSYFKLVFTAALCYEQPPRGRACYAGGCCSWPPHRCSPPVHDDHTFLQQRGHDGFVHSPRTAV